MVRLFWKWVARNILAYTPKTNWYEPITVFDRILAEKLHEDYMITTHVTKGNTKELKALKTLYDDLAKKVYTNENMH